MSRAPGVDPAATVDPSAEVAADARVGAGTSISQGARIGLGARIGADCRIGREVLIDAGVHVGDRVVIGDGAMLFSGVTIEDGVLIGPRAMFTNERHPRAVSTSAELAAAGVATVPGTVVRSGSSIGAAAVLVAGIEVGAYGTIGAGAVVTKPAAGHALVAGNPAQRLGWVCSCGTPLVDAEGAPAAAEPPHYSRHPELACPSCGRVFVYVPEPEGLAERQPTVEARPA